MNNAPEKSGPKLLSSSAMHFVTSYFELKNFFFKIMKRKKNEKKENEIMKRKKKRKKEQE